MYALNFKKWWHLHAIRNDIMLWTERIISDERFWPGVFAVTLIVLFVGLIVWAGLYGEAHPGKLPTYPYTPYIY